MGAKIVLSGEAHNIRREGDVVTFTIHTGPATRHPPPGLKLYGATRFQIACAANEWERVAQGQNEHPALIVEGYLEPRQDETTGSLYVAVAATELQSVLAHSRRRRERLERSLDEARRAFKAARDAAASQPELEEKAAALVQANQALTRFLRRHPGLTQERSD